MEWINIHPRGVLLNQLTKGLVFLTDFSAGKFIPMTCFLLPDGVVTNYTVWEY